MFKDQKEKSKLRELLYDIANGFTAGIATDPHIEILTVINPNSKFLQINLKERRPHKKSRILCVRITVLE